MGLFLATRLCMTAIASLLGQGWQSLWAIFVSSSHGDFGSHVFHVRGGGSSSTLYSRRGRKKSGLLGHWDFQVLPRVAAMSTWSYMFKYRHTLIIKHIDIYLIVPMKCAFSLKKLILANHILDKGLISNHIHNSYNSITTKPPKNAI